MARLGDKLNYNSMKQSAMESKSIRSVIPPRSGVTFQEGQILEFEIPSNRPQEYLDLVNNLKIKLPVTLSGTDASMKYDRAGAYSLVNRWEFVQNGVVLVNVPRANVLLTGLSDFQMSQEYKASQGRLLEGMEGDCLRGAIQAKDAAGKRTFYLSVLGTDLHMTTPQRDLYLGSSAPIILRITLETAKVALKGVTDDMGYTIERPELLINTTFLYKESMDELARAVKGNYRMLCNSYDHMSATLAANTTNAHIKLSFAKSSLERILFFIRPSAHIAAHNKFSLGSRGTANLSSYQLDVAGTLVPQVPIKTDEQGADFMYHLLHSDNIASNYSAGVGGLMNAYTIGVSTAESGTGSLGSAPEISKTNPFIEVGAETDGDNEGVSKSSGAANSVASNIATFIGAVNLESGLITSQNSPLYSGISTKNGVDMYIDMVFANTGTPYPCTIDFYSLSTEMIELDPDTNLWRKLS